MVEEEFAKDIDEDDDIGIVARPDSTLDGESVLSEAEQDKITKQFTRDERVGSFQDMAYINKFARNCPPASLMSLLTV